MNPQCPGTKLYDGVQDQAYDGGTLVLSELGENFHTTFCARTCYNGIVTAGIASGDKSKERDVLLSKIGVNSTLSAVWSTREVVKSPLVLSALDTHKQDSVRDIIVWFKSAHSITFNNEDVYFFDDRPDNVKPFEGTGFNAHQVSCGSRDHTMSNVTGDCGGRLAEVVQEKGVHLCGGSWREDLQVDPSHNLLPEPRIVANESSHDMIVV
jgi:hypothetical protein